MSKRERGISAPLVAAAAVIAIFAAVAVYFFVFQPGGNVMVFADFEAPGTRPGGSRGIMPDNTLISEADVEGGFSGRALRLTYSFSSGEWCGYWMNFRADESGYDVSKYQYIKMWVKGESGNERFKIELKDTSDGASYAYAGAGGTGYVDISLGLSQFQKVPWADKGADLSSLKQVNIVFDTEPMRGTLYVDEIRFTG